MTSGISCPTFLNSPVHIVSPQESPVSPVPPVLTCLTLPVSRVLTCHNSTVLPQESLVSPVLTCLTSPVSPVLTCLTSGIYCLTCLAFPVSPQESLVSPVPPVSLVLTCLNPPVLPQESLVSPALTCLTSGLSCLTCSHLSYLTCLTCPNLSHLRNLLSHLSHLTCHHLSHLRNHLSHLSCLPSPVSPVLKSGRDVCLTIGMKNFSTTSVDFPRKASPPIAGQVLVTGDQDGRDSGRVNM